MVPPDRMASKVGSMIVMFGNAESASAVNGGVCATSKRKSKLVIVPVSMKKDGEMKSHVGSQLALVVFISKVTEPGQSVDPDPPFTPRPGSGMPVASATLDDSPRMPRISKQRKIFTSAPPHTKLSKAILEACNVATKLRQVVRKYSLCLP